MNQEDLTDQDILIRIAGEEEVRSLNEQFGSEITLENFGLDSIQKSTPTKSKKRTAEEKSSLFRRKNRKVLLLKCAHDGDHFEKCYIEESIELSQISVVMNCQTDSIIWSFCGFPEIDGKICCNFVICAVCKSIFTYDGSTSGAKRHVEAKHKQEVQEIKKMGHVEPGQVLVADYGEHALPMRLVCDSDVVEPQLATISNGEISDISLAAVTVEGSIAETRGVRVVINGYDSDEVKPLDSAVKYSKERDTRENFNFDSFNTTKCIKCNVDFKNVALAMMHRSAHGTKGDFSCAQCGKVLQNCFDFWNHLYKRSCM